MSRIHKTISKIYNAEITEKKSRFIAAISPAKTEEEAVEFIKGCKKKYHDARHNCSAYIIGTDGHLMHSSDDGEPSGTAGRPMLSILEGNGLYDVVAVVTRYFGGVLLGTGGLVRAYSGALEKCIASARLITMCHGAQIKIEASYTDIGKLQYLFNAENITVLSTDYTDKVVFNVIVPAEIEERLISLASEATLRKAVIEIIQRAYFEL